MNFGTLMKELRIGKELTLRQCSADLDVDPSNWSKIERNITPPPKDPAVLERWATFFALTGDRKMEFSTWRRWPATRSPTTSRVTKPSWVPCRYSSGRFEGRN
jgi:transcriptional regulator with XRE-family HTH domain